MTRVGTAAVALGAAALSAAGVLSAGAQVAPVPIPGSPSTTAPATTTTTSPIALPNLDPAQPTKPVPPTTVPARPPAPPPAPAIGVPGGGAGDSGVIPADAGPFPADLAAMSRSVKRTGSRSTRALMDALAALEPLGVPRDEAIRVGMGQFPVGGYATYSHDWWFPRFGPGWRLHQGTDIFATRGTPVRAPASGTIRFANGGLGGIAAYVVQSDATYFYLAHLDGRPPGLRDGQAVTVGDTVGYVGSSGNASGGSPHLHFEYHPAVRYVTKGKGKRATTVAVPLKVRPGTMLPAADPKQFLDLSLQHAMAHVPQLVATYQAKHDAVVAAAVPAAPVAAINPVALGAAGLAPLRAARLSPAAKLPLAGMAFLLVLIVGSLTPVLAPSRGALPGHAARSKKQDQSRAPAERPAPTGDEARRRRLRRRREPQPSTGGAATAATAATSVTLASAAAAMATPNGTGVTRASPGATASPGGPAAPRRRPLVSQGRRRRPGAAPLR